MTLEAFSDRSRSHNPLLLAVRFLLYWVIRALVVLFRWIRFLFRPALVRYGLLIVLVAGAVAWKSLGTPAFLPWLPSDSTPGTLVSTSATTQPPPAPVVERYLQAQANFDAKGMWDTMSDPLKQRMTLANNSETQIQNALDSARQLQRNYTAITYIGGHALGSNQMVYFYVLTMKSPTGTSQIPYTFVVDQNGKISNIQWSM